MNLQFRKATRDDLDAIVRLLADDVLGAKRERYETPLPESYLRAFEAIDADPNNELVVARMDGEVGPASAHLHPLCTYQGGWRALIEAAYAARGASSRVSGLCTAWPPRLSTCV